VLIVKVSSREPGSSPRTHSRGRRSRRSEKREEKIDRPFSEENVHYSPIVEGIWALSHIPIEFLFARRIYGRKYRGGDWRNRGR